MPSEVHEKFVDTLLGAAPPAQEPSLEQSRGEFAGLIGASGLRPGATVTAHTIGGVDCQVVEADTAERTHVVWIHGGGFVLGDAVSYAAPLSRLFAGLRVTIVEYRRAPEHPLPAALDDFLAVYQGLIDSGERADQIVVGGDSAGGGLVVLALQRLRDTPLPLPAGAILISPWSDYSLGEHISASALSQPDPLLARDGLASFARAFTGGDSALAASLTPTNGDLNGLPRTQIEYGSRDITAPDAERLAARLGQAGVDVAIQRGDGLIHVYPVILPESDEGRQAASRIAGFARRVTGNEH